MWEILAKYSGQHFCLPSFLANSLTCGIPSPLTGILKHPHFKNVRCINWLNVRFRAKYGGCNFYWSFFEKTSVKQEYSEVSSYFQMRCTLRPDIPPPVFRWPVSRQNLVKFSDGMYPQTRCTPLLIKHWSLVDHYTKSVLWQTDPTPPSIDNRSMAHHYTPHKFHI